MSSRDKVTQAGLFKERLARGPWHACCHRAALLCLACTRLEPTSVRSASFASFASFASSLAAECRAGATSRPWPMFDSLPHPYQRSVSEAIWP